MFTTSETVNNELNLLFNQLSSGDSVCCTLHPYSNAVKHRLNFEINSLPQSTTIYKKKYCFFYLEKYEDIKFMFWEKEPTIESRFQASLWLEIYPNKVDIKKFRYLYEKPSIIFEEEEEW